MRRLVVLSALSLLAAACGGSDKKSPDLTGTVGGKAFAVADVRAVIADTGTGTCSLPVGGANYDLFVSGLKLDFTSWADACAAYASASCQFHGDGQTVSVIVARLGQPGSFTTAPPLQVTTYTIAPDPTYLSGDGEGGFVSAFGQATSFTAAPACDPTTSPSVLNGKLKLTSVSASGVSGNISVTFQDGSTLSGDFSAPACPGFDPDICQLAATQSFCTLPATCLP